MKTLTKEELSEILKLHRSYLAGEAGGKRANLGYADLRNADLRNADLRYANLGYANLRYADLRYANLRYADLDYANLRYADLGYADLGYADLGGANLGAKRELSKMLFLIGACSDSIAWVEKQKDHSDPMALLARAEPEWKNWLAERLRGEPSFERLKHVIDYVTGGRGVPE